MSTTIRALRADLAAAVRRAGAGETTTVTVGGRPVARLGPLEDRGGDVIPPRRTSTWRPPAAVTVWSGVRIDRALER